MTSDSSRLEKLRSLVARNPEAPFPRYGLAMELRERGDLETAAATFSELLERCPTYIPAYLHYGTVLSQLSREEQASSIFRQGMEVSLQGGEQHAYEELHSALEQLTGEE